MPFGNTFHGRNTYVHIFTCLPSSPSNYLIAEGWTRCYAHIVLKTGRCILLHKHMKTSMTNQIHGQSKSGTAFRTQWKTCQCLRNACTVAKWIQSTAAQSMLWSNNFMYSCTETYWWLAALHVHVGFVIPLMIRVRDWRLWIAIIALHCQPETTRGPSYFLQSNTNACFSSV